MVASKLSANLSFKTGKLEISSVDADLLGGMHRGKWQADFGVKPAACSGSGNLVGISLNNVSRLMQDNWVGGTASASYDIRGSCDADFWQSLEATVQVNVVDGSLPHVFLEDGAETLKIGKFTAQARLRNGEVELSDARLDSPPGKYEISGIATFKREIDLKMTPVPAGSGITAYSVTGTLAQPHVAALNGAEQARLKPPTK